ncbi:MAG TPA: hypothetical protein VHC20_06660 [Candidatus Paceibacterota bacterium]|nr:hypothetical protein [Candidatus Paceibacterota bacterium]
MKALFVSIALVLASVMSGCFSRSVASKYRDIVGHDFVTAREMTLSKMQQYQYVHEPYQLLIGGPGQFGAAVRSVPAGTRIHVVDVRFKPSIDAGFDYLIADLYLDSGSAPIRFEQIADDASAHAFFVRDYWRKID